MSEWKLVILESPYSGEIERNVDYARECVRDCVLGRESPQASHLLFTQPGVLKDEIPEERALGIEAGLAWRPKSDYSVFYTDHGWSNGMIEALKSCMDDFLQFRIRALHGPIKLPPHALMPTPETKQRIAFAIDMSNRDRNE